MVLDSEALVLLNNRMLSLGVPVERDYSGYNIPDFALAYNMAYIPSDRLKNIELYAIVSTLCNYKNTQLEEFRGDLEETLDFYEKTLQRNAKERYKELVKNANMSYKPVGRENVLYFVSFDENTGFVTIHHDGRFAKEVDFKNNHKGEMRLVNSGSYDEPVWNSVVHLSLLKEYLSLMSERYDLSSELQRFSLNIESYMQKHEERMEKSKLEATEKAKNAKKVSLVRESDEGIELHFEGFVSSLSDFIRSNKDSGFRWVKRGNAFNVFVPYAGYDFFKETYEKGGYSFELVLKAASDIEEKAEKASERENNPYEMVSMDKLDIPFNLYDFQIEDIKRALTKKRFLIGHDMGCGKSIMSAVIGESIPVRKLVICPESLRLNWKKEIRFARNDAKIAVLYSKDNIDEADLDVDYVICGYHTATKYKDRLLEENFECVFVDEVHNCKAVNNSGKPTSKRAEAVLDIAMNAEFLYVLTGTPIPTRNKDLFNILKMLDIKDIDVSSKGAFFKYGLRYCDGYKNGFGWDFSGNSNGGELHDILSKHMIRRLKKDVLPNLTKQRVFIPMETTRREYKKIEKELREGGDDSTYMGLAMKGRSILSKDKVTVAIDLANSILEEGKSVVIVSNFNDTLDKVKETYGDNCCEIRGGIGDERKQKAIDDFQSGAKKVCALNIIAGGVGVTLTKASDMIICDYDWTPSNMSQVEDRICRSGQENHCLIHYIYCENSTLDRVFVDMITGKSANIDAVVDGGENSMDLATGVKNSYLDMLKKAVEEDDTYEKPAKKTRKKSNKKEENANTNEILPIEEEEDGIFI